MIVQTFADPSNPPDERSVTETRLRPALPLDTWQLDRDRRLTEREARYDRHIADLGEGMPYTSASWQADMAASYRRERDLQTRAEDLASELLDVAAELGWGNGEPAAAAHGWVYTVAAARGLVLDQPPRREPTRREVADRAIQKAFRRIGERDGFYCRRCGKDRTLTVDHVTAVINGGTDDDDNLQLLCRSHNSAKGTGPDQVA